MLTSTGKVPYLCGDFHSLRLDWLPGPEVIGLGNESAVLLLARNALSLWACLTAFLPKALTTLHGWL